MEITIKQVEDAIVNALANDSVIKDWPANVYSADDIVSLRQKIKGIYPVYGVVYFGAPDPVGPLAGGTGAGASFAREGEFEIHMIDKNVRGEQAGRHGDPVSGSKHVGVYQMLEEAIRVVVYKDLGMDIKKFNYAGDELADVPWDPNAVGMILRIRTQWETVCQAD